MKNDFQKFESKYLDESKESQERVAVLQFTLSIIGFSLSGVIIRFAKAHLVTYNEFSFSFVRFLLMAIFNWYVLLKNRIDSPVIETQDIKWIICRSTTVSFGFLCLVMSIQYLRLGTAICIAMISPLMSSMFSYLILKEECYTRYVVGGVICFTGTVFMTYNEGDSLNPSYSGSSYAVYIGALYSLGYALFTALCQISSKILANKYDSFYLNYNLGIVGSLIMLYCGLFSKGFASYCMDPKLIFYCFLNTVVSIISFHYQNISYKYVGVNKVTMLAYLQMVISSGFGYFVFDEMLYFLDILGALMIVGYNLYNFWVMTKGGK